MGVGGRTGGKPGRKKKRSYFQKRETPAAVDPDGRPLEDLDGDDCLGDYDSDLAAAYLPPCVWHPPRPPAGGLVGGLVSFKPDGLINLDAGGSDEDDGEPSSGGPDVEPAADCCQVEDEYELPRQPSDCLDPDPHLPEKRIRIRRDLYVAKPATPTKPGRHRSCPRARRRHKGKKERTETTTVPTKGWVAGPLYMEFGPKDGRGS